MDNHHLILSRRKGEKIIIAIDLTALPLTPSPIDESGTLLTIGTHDIRKSQVIFDFYAPTWVRIWREETLRRLLKQPPVARVKQKESGGHAKT